MAAICLKRFLFTATAAAMFAGLAVIISPAITSTAMAMDSNVVAKGGPDLTKARSLIKSEDWPAAFTELKKLEAASDPNADVFNLLGFSARKQGLFDVSLTYYTKALKIDPKHLAAHVYLGELYIQTGKFDEAIKQAQTLAELCPTGCPEQEELKKALASAGY